VSVLLLLVTLTTAGRRIHLLARMVIVSILRNADTFVLMVSIMCFIQEPIRAATLVVVVVREGSSPNI